MASAAKTTDSGATYQVTYDKIIVDILLKGLPQHFQEAIRPYLYSVILGSGVDLRKDLPKELAIIRDRLNIVRSNPQIMLNISAKKSNSTKTIITSIQKQVGDYQDQQLRERLNRMGPSIENLQAQLNRMHASNMEALLASAPSPPKGGKRSRKQRKRRYNTRRNK
jgi:hypothetical protein